MIHDNNLTTTMFIGNLRSGVFSINQYVNTRETQDRIYENLSCPAVYLHCFDPCDITEIPESVYPVSGYYRIVLAHDFILELICCLVFKSYH